MGTMFSPTTSHRHFYLPLAPRPIDRSCPGQAECAERWNKNIRLAIQKKKIGRFKNQSAEQPNKYSTKQVIRQAATSRSTTAGWLAKRRIGDNVANAQETG